MGGPVMQMKTSDVICVDGRCKEKDTISVKQQQHQDQKPCPHAFLRGSVRDFFNQAAAAGIPQAEPKVFLTIGTPSSEQQHNVLIGAPWRSRPRVQNQNVPSPSSAGVSTTAGAA